MKPILLALSLAGMTCTLSAKDPIEVSQLPEFATAAEWARDLQSRRPSFTLAHVAETEWKWFAVFWTVEKHLVWCERAVGERPAGRGSRSITGPDGKSLLAKHSHDPAHDRERPESGRNFQTPFKISLANGWEIRTRDDGSLISLIQPLPPKVRIRYQFRSADGRETTVLDEVFDF